MHYHNTGVAGADAHKHTIKSAVLTTSGAPVDTATFEITPGGLVQLHAWLDRLPVTISRIGIEGSASWGLAVACFLLQAGFDVREVNPARTSDGDL